MPDAMLLIGDEAMHGETAYHLDLPPHFSQSLYEMEGYSKSVVTEGGAGPSQ